MEKLEKLLFDYDGTTELYRLDSLDFLHGFIKWLVENDKVKELRPIEEERIYTQEELLLMKLAISDTPIEDFILYLK